MIRTLLILSMAISASGVHHLHAQPVNNTLAPVIVTATKTERPTDSVPQSVDVIDQEQLEITQPANFGDVMENLPNVDIAGGPRSQAERIIIRGLEDNRILFTLDGARQNFVLGAHKGRFFVDPELLKRVEVVRGPNSAIWGSGALGGVVALTSKDASDLLRERETFGARLKTGYHTVNEQWQLGATVFGLSGDEQALDYLLSINGKQADDTEDGDGVVADSASDTLSGLGKVTWMNEQHQIGLSAQWYDEEGDIPSNASEAASDSNPLLDRKTQQQTYTLNYRYALSEQQQLHATLYRTHIDIEETRKDNGRFDQTDFVTTGLDIRHSVHFASGQQQHVLTYGVDIYQDDAEARRDGAPRTSFPDGDTQVLGVFVQDEWRLGQRRLTLIPALRYDRYTHESSAEVGEDASDNEVSVQLGVLFALTDHLTLTADYAEAFRAPNLSELYTTGIHFGANTFVANPNLKPERAANKEIGLRYRRTDWLTAGDRFRAQINYFRNDVKDFIEQQVIVVPLSRPPFVGGTTTVANVSNAKLTGFEAVLAYEHPRFFAKLSYGLTRGEDSDTGVPLASIAPDHIRLTLGQRLPTRALRYGLRLTWVDDQDRVPADVSRTEGYQIADVFLSWQPTAALRVNAGIDNLTNKTYRRHLSALNEPGRNFKLSLAYQF